MTPGSGFAIHPAGGVFHEASQNGSSAQPSSVPQGVEDPPEESAESTDARRLEALNLSPPFGRLSL